MKVAIRFYQTLAKVLEQKHQVKIELNLTEKGGKVENNNG